MFNDDLIKVYHNTIDKEYCDYIIETFENSTGKIDGLSGGGVNPHMKKSVDLMIMDYKDDENWSQIYNYLRENLLGNFVDYITSNPYMIKDRSDDPQPASEVCMLRTAQSAYKSSANGTPHSKCNVTIMVKVITNGIMKMKVVIHQNAKCSLFII